MIAPNSIDPPPGKPSPPRFALGRVVATPGALSALKHNGQDPAELLHRHQSGDWGAVSVDDAQANDAAVNQSERLLSAYVLADQTRLWIITEADRSSTCILLPDEY